jgi:hypothetical protein
MWVGSAAAAVTSAAASREVRQRHVGRVAICLAVGLVCMLGIGVMSASAKPLDHFSGNNQGSFVREDLCDMKVRIDFRL